MRVGSSSISQNKTFSKNNIIKGLPQRQRKNFNPNVSDEFQLLNAWSPIRGVWNTDGENVSTITDSTSYPILTSYDLRSENITATMSLISSGVGIVFWLQDPLNWWAGVTFYTQSSESYTVGTFSCQPCYNTCHWAIYCPAGKGSSCQGVCCSANCSAPQYLGGGTVCSTCYTPGTRTRYNFYIRLLKSIDGVVNQEAVLNLRSTASASTEWSPATVSTADNINGIQLITSGNNITLRGRDDTNNFYSSSISYTASNPNLGSQSGIIFTPGVTIGSPISGASNYLVSSVVDRISIIGA
jgi:hypothetical protein